MCLFHNIAEGSNVSEFPTSCNNDVADDQDDSMIRQNILDSILGKYDKRFPPFYNSEAPLEVEVQIYVVGIFGIDESEMKYSMSMYLRQQWTDPKLKYNATAGIPRIELDNTVQSKIWVPDLSFMTDIETEFHYVTVPNKMMILHPTGFIIYSTRVTGTFSCFMHLQNFPFDEQMCAFELESYGFSAATVAFRWKHPAMTFKEGIVHSQFTIGSPQSYICDKEYFTGNYTCVGISLPFRRRYEFYLIQVYAPTLLIVMLSWVSFWLNTDAIPARVSLGILTVLTVSSSGHQGVGLLQRVSYIRAIDMWNFVCLFFVFAAMIEYAYIAMISRVDMRKKLRQHKIINFGVSIIQSKQVEEVEENIRLEENKERARTIDKVSRIAFPVSFFIFNVIYWTYFMTRT